jgi:hypothetical protein
MWLVVFKECLAGNDGDNGTFRGLDDCRFRRRIALSENDGGKVIGFILYSYITIDILTTIRVSTIIQIHSALDGRLEIVICDEALKLNLMARRF